MARITKAQIIEATRVEVRLDPIRFDAWANDKARCRRKSHIHHARCTREYKHKGPHVTVWRYKDSQTDIQGVWFSADQKMKDMYEHYRNS